MNEKNLKVFEQYELEVSNVRRGRDCYIAETNRGLVMLREYNGSNKRCEWVEGVCSRLEESGMEIDKPIRNREGSFVSADREERRFLVKHWINGREPDVKHWGEMVSAAGSLASLHKELVDFHGDVVYRPFWCEVFEKRMKELRKIYRYVRGKKRKNAFELEFLNQYQRFMEPCLHAQQCAAQERLQNLQKRQREAGCVCHGDYNQHNILRYDGKMTAVNFENCAVGSQTEDLYCFMRKMLEKHNWSKELADAMLQEYEKQQRLSEDELLELYIQFEFSEKFWKICNHYYNSKKTWIPDRSLQKLDKIVGQSDARDAFLNYFYQKYVTV